MFNALFFLGIILIMLFAAWWMVWGKTFAAARRDERKLSREAELWLRAYTIRRARGGPRFPAPAPEIPQEHPRRNEGPRP